MKTDFQKIIKAIEKLSEAPYHRMLEVIPDTKIILGCFSLYQSIEFSFDGGRLVHITIKTRRDISAQLEWIVDLVGAKTYGEEIHLYANSNRFAKIDVKQGALYCK